MGDGGTSGVYILLSLCEAGPDPKYPEILSSWKMSPARAERCGIRGMRVLKIEEVQEASTNYPDSKSSKKHLKNIESEPVSPMSRDANICSKY